MTMNPDQSIQPGWSVMASDGEDLGTVVSVDPSNIHVKKGGLIGSSVMDIPRSYVDEVETGRVELSVTKSELKSGR